MFTYKTAKFAPVWTTILKIRAIFVHQTSTEHPLLVPENQNKPKMPDIHLFSHVLCGTEMVNFCDCCYKTRTRLFIGISVT